MALSGISADVVDTVYTRPPRKPFEAMPAGGGDLLAMVRVTDAIELHLGKCDAWGFRDWHNRIHHCELLSPGHVTIHLSPDPLAPETLLSYEQRLSPLRGAVEATLHTRTGDLRVAVWGDMARNVLVVEVQDERSDRGPAEVELSQWRNTAGCQVGDGCLLSEETQTEAVLPERAPGQLDPYLGRCIGLAVASDISTEVRWLGRENASLYLPADGPARYRVLIACEVTPSTPAAESEDPSAIYYRGGQWDGNLQRAPGQALQTLRAALGVPAVELRAQHDAWWQAFWKHSGVRLEGDADAAYLTRLWHLFYYQMAISSRGPYHTKFNGGPGLFERDLRSWQLFCVWQNDREHLWPLDAGNHSELTGNVWRMYAGMLPYLRQLTRETWGLDGVWLPEVHQPWWDLLPGSNVASLATPNSSERGHAGGLRRDQPPNYTSHIFSSGPELVQQMLDHVRHTGDEAFLREVAYPWLAGVCEFYVNWAALGEDGLYHFGPANANEMWWKVQDTLSDLCAVRVLFPEFIALAARDGQDAAPSDASLAARCREILARLPDLPEGKWRTVREGERTQVEIDRTQDVYGAARELLAETRHHNQENPECYLIFPWSLTGVGAPNRERAMRTYALRDFRNTAGWSQCGVQAARLGLCEEAADIILDHARRQQKFPYGGWNSPGAMLYRLADGTRLADCAYLDSAGENATAIQEMLMQSYPLRLPQDAAAFSTAASNTATPDAGENRAPDVPYGVLDGGVIRLCPAVPARWSGAFRLHAMGGFLVECEFADGQPTRARIIGERASGRCRVANPWPGGAYLARADGGRTLLQGDVLAFDTIAGELYTLSPA